MSLAGKTIGFIGAGAMAEALAGGLIAAGVARPRLLAADVDEARRRHVKAALEVRTTADNAELVEHSDVVVLSVKPNVVGPVIEELLSAAAEWPHLEVAGLMTIPAAEADPERSRPVFARLRELRDALRVLPGGAGLHELSMGMTADFEVAIEEGATIVRVGTAIFGPRPDRAAARDTGES